MVQRMDNLHSVHHKNEPSYLKGDIFNDGQTVLVCMFNCKVKQTGPGKDNYMNKQINLEVKTYKFINISQSVRTKTFENI